MDRPHPYRNPARRFWPLVRLLLIAALLSTNTGCQIIIGVLLSLTGRDLIEADFKKDTGKDMTEKGKRVVVLCTSPEKAKGDYSALDVDVITELSRRLKANTIDVVDAHRVATWLDDRGGIVDDAELGSLGKKFKADFVILVDIKEFSYRAEHSPGLFKGQTQGSVTVVEVNRKKKDPAGDPVVKTIYISPFQSEYPLHKFASADEVSAVTFRKQYLDRIAEELARRFYDHRPGEEF